ncbi:MAG: hypothetical protein ACXWR0_12810 [Bdellovibrio sp.]
MFFLVRASVIFALALSLTACSGGGGNGNTGGNPPQSKEEALNKLSSEHKANFEAWKKKVAKSCDATQAFDASNDPQSEQNGVDESVLMLSNHQSLIFSDGKNLAILTDHQSISGIGTTKFETTTSINGQSYSIKAETKREGSHCTVYLYGQKVYETTLFQNYTIGIQYNPKTQVSSTSQNPVINALGSHGSHEVIQHGLYSLLSQFLTPSKDAQNMMGQILGLDANQTARLFPLGHFSGDNLIAKIAEDSASVWSSPQYGNLVGSEDTLKKYFDGNNRTIRLEVRFKVPQYQTNETKNPTDNGNLKLLIDANISKKDTLFSYTLASTLNNGVVLFSEDEALACAKERLNAYLDTNNHYAIIPSTQTVMQPCSALLPQVEETAFEKGFYKNVLPVIFSGVVPSAQTQYGGWNFVLTRLAQNVLEKDKDIKAELDPTGSTTIIPLISNIFSSLKTKIDKSKNMQALKNAVLEMGAMWSFQGQNVADDRITQIIQSLDHSADVFKESSAKLIGDLSIDPNSNAEQLSFANSIDEAYKSEAKKGQQLAKDLEYSDFETDVFNQIIQKKVSIDELRAWSNKLSVVKGEINKYNNLNTIRGDIAGTSIKWLNSGELTTQDLESVYSALNNAAIPFVESFKELIKDLKQSFASNKEAVEFARNLTDEYKQLAIAVKANSTSANYESWGISFFNSVLQKRPTIDQVRRWNNLWISVLSFVKREQTKLAGSTSSIPEWNRKSVIELAIKETWSEQEFVALEAVSQVAKFKNVCKNYNDASSLADCSGLNLYSLGQGKFFDPAYNGRYPSLAADFNSYLSQLSNFNSSSLQWSLLDEFFNSWGPIWSKCDNSTFKQKAETLKGQVNAIANENDQVKKWNLESQIKETIKNCQ